MITSELEALGQPMADLASGARQIVNDFSIQIATVNGSGSQSANSVLLRSIFRMGVPVSGKNLFPSNIAGLPTWYTIRVSQHGWVARKTDIDILIAMNPETAREDVLSLAPGAAVIYDESLKLNELRGDVTYYAVPFDQLAAATGADAKLRKLIKNMVYVGVAAQLLSIDMEWVEKTVRKQFAKKVKAAELNLNAVRVGFDYAKSTLTKQDPFIVEPMDATRGKIIIDGNAAAAMGAMFAGVTVVAWYPITPSSSVVENLIDLMKRYRVEPDGKATFAIVQAEDELAAVGMVLGAGWAGARSMTSSSGPGISLMAEFAGLGYYAEIPGVIFDIQRTGPSTGLPTRTSQADLTFVAGISHGDTKHVILLPGTVKECFEFAIEAFDLAEQLQTPIFVLSDLDLGMNNWMSEPFEYPEKPISPRQGPRRTAAHRTRRLRPLQGRRRRRHPLPHPPRHGPPRRRILHPRLRPQREGPLHRAPRRLREQHAAPRAQVRDRAHPRPQATSSRAPAARASASSPSAPATGPSSRAATSSTASPASAPTTSASAPTRSPRRSTTSSPPTTASTSWSRTATRRCSTYSRSISIPSRS